MTRGRRIARRGGLAALALAAATLLPALSLGAAPASAADDDGSTGAGGSGKCEAGSYTWIPARPPAFDSLQTDLAWQRTRGENVLVAVVDSGVDAANQHLAGAMAGGIDLVGDGYGANGLADPAGHGTAIAAEIAGRKLTDEDSGLVGLAPAARILSVRVYQGDSEESIKAGFGPKQEVLAKGIRYAADAGAQVINVSLSTSVDDPGVRSAVAYAESKGSLIVASAGNRNTAQTVGANAKDGPRYPAGNAGVLAVTAVAADGTVNDDSIHGPHVGIAAPGQNVLAAKSGGGDCYFATDAASSSYATGYVSGAAALVAAAYPGETPAQWRYRLEASAIRADPDHRDDLYGWGLVQPYDAIALEPGPGIRGPSSPFGSTDRRPTQADGGAIRPDHGAPAFALTTATGVLIGVVGATLLGTVGVLVVLLRRRRSERDEG